LTFVDVFSEKKGVCQNPFQIFKFPILLHYGKRRLDTSGRKLR